MRTEAAESSSNSVRRELRRLEWRDWSLWSASFVILLLLLAGIASFAQPGAEFGLDLFGFDRLQMSVRALLGLVLLFTSFTVYQQVQIHRLRRLGTEHLAHICNAELRAQALEQMTLLDPLTGLYNRRFAQQHLSTEIARANRLGYQLTIALLDLNDFKAINDRYGHLAGDCVLREFAQCLRTTFRSSDMILRLGGDEFLVALPECSGQSVGCVLARLEGLSAVWEGRRLPYSFAAGCSECRPGDGVDSLIRRADEALYRNKAEGKRGGNVPGRPLPVRR